MNRNLILFCSMMLFICFSRYLAIAQVCVSSVPEGKLIYSDTTLGYSFCIPNWFSIKKDQTYREVMDVLESGEPSFEFSIKDITDNKMNDYYDEYVGKNVKNSGDDFIEAAKRTTFFSCVNSYHGLISYGRLDSLKEFKSLGGQRVLIAYRKEVDIDGNPSDEYHQTGPLCIVDIPAKPNDKLLVFDFYSFDFNNAVYRNLALSVVLSVQIK